MNPVDDPLDVFGCPLDGIRLIEASAGTGKTWNLCVLVLRLLLERGLALPQVLVVTYTNAAAAELRERIRQRLAGTLAHLRGTQAPAGDPFVPRLVDSLRRQGHADDTMARRLALALAGFDEASIFTIHAFCQRALADAPFTAGLPLAGELLPDDSDIVQGVANDFWRRRVLGDAVAPWLAARLLRQRDTPERFAGLLRRQQSRPSARCLWPRSIDDAGEPDAHTLGAAHQAARALWHGARGEVTGLLHTALDGVLNGQVYKPAMLDEVADAWDRRLECEDAVAALPFGHDRLDRFASRVLQAKTRKGRTAPAHPFFDAAQALLDAADAFEQAAERARLRLLRDLLDEGRAELARAKQQRHVMSYDDLLRRLHERLVDERAGPALRDTLRRRFPAALIDEFQDTDPLQWSIFETLYGAGGLSLCLIGDPKQAIYGFRNADLPTYLRARARAAGTSTLLDNQRSTAPLLAALNRLFGANPAVFMDPGLVYRAVGIGARPRPRLVDRSAPGADPAALQLWALPTHADTGLPLAVPLARDAVARAVAAEIARLLGAARQGDITLDGRPLRAGDIAVLVRGHADGALMRQALAALGVGCVELSQASVFHGSDAEELDRLLAAVLEPTRCGLVKAALAGTAMGWDAAAIESLDHDEARLLAVVQRLDGYRQGWLQRGVGVMLRQWLADEQVAARLLPRSDGERRLTNLLHLAELLHEAAAEHPAPDALHRWLQQQRRDTRVGERAQQRLESDQDLVQIVTIHKSKGLEFPLVFCPTLWRATPPSGSDGLPGAEDHDDDGHAVVDFRRGFAGEFDELAFKARRRRAAAAESLRLVYVALTRAVHRCVLVQGLYASGRSGSTTGSRRGLLHWLVAGAGIEPADWFDHKLGDAALAAAWRAWADAGGAGEVSLAPLPAHAGTPLPPDAGGPDGFAALPAPQRWPAAWKIGSYSSLVHRLDAERHPGPAADHDHRVGDAPAPPAPAIAADDILRFPRGAAAGVCLHAVFEHADFTDSASWPAAVRRGLSSLAPAGTEAAAGAAHTAMLMRMLADVLATELPVGTARPWRLAELPRRRRLSELEFHLPASALDGATLNGWLARHGVPVPALQFSLPGGAFKGVIDLVAEHDGRWFVVDWKSNHLGDTPADYAAAPLAAAMQQHAYHLQALLYAVALHRLLRWRLPGYAIEKHFGGVLYLFVRGLRPLWRDADGRPTGQHFQRPAPALIEGLSALLGPAGDRA